MLLVAIIAAIALTLRRRKDSRYIDPAEQVQGASKADRLRIVQMKPVVEPPPAPPRRRRGAAGRQAMNLGTITLGHYLSLGGDPVRAVGDRHLPEPHNLIVLLMAIELMLLAVNLNFVAFSHYLGDMHGQVFVFFILTVAAAESAIGLAILVVLFRNRATINVDELDALKG